MQLPFGCLQIRKFENIQLKAFFYKLSSSLSWTGIMINLVIVQWLNCLLIIKKINKKVSLVTWIANERKTAIEVSCSNWFWNSFTINCQADCVLSYDKITFASTKKEKFLWRFWRAFSVQISSSNFFLNDFTIYIILLFSEEEFWRFVNESRF